MKSQLIMLVGPPATGKTYFATLYPMSYKIVSSDDFIEDYARRQGMTYDEVWPEYHKMANNHFFNSLNESLANGENIIVDRTNLTRASRKRILSLVPDNYDARAVVFGLDIPVKVWVERVTGREGKIIPFDTLVRMWKTFEQPSYDEGFIEISKPI